MKLVLAAAVIAGLVLAAVGLLSTPILLGDYVMKVLGMGR